MTPPDAAPDPLPFASDPPVPRASVEDLAARFRERLCLFAARRLGNPELAEDVAQETLRRVTDAVKAGRLREPAALPGFVFQTALHICLQHLRSSEREARSLVRLAAVASDADAPDALATLIAAERRATVHRALTRLGGEDRELLRMMYFQGLEPVTIARLLGLSPGTLRVRKHRALQRLGHLLDGAVA